MTQNRALLNKSINDQIDPNVKQRSAADPSQSVWVGASAGSGKTKVLTDRVLRLLLPDQQGLNAVTPEKILALTFTKAAASEMAIRINEELGKWAIMPLDANTSEKNLIGTLEFLLGYKPTDHQIITARQLFAKVIDVPGGLKIMTIHSFCTSILGRFPLEADLCPNFKAIEENESKPLLEKAIHLTVQKAQIEKGSELAEAFYNLALIQNEDQIYDLIQKLVSERRQIEQILKHNFGATGLFTRLCDHFGINDNLTHDEIIKDACLSDSYDESALRNVCTTLAAGTPKTDQPRGQTIQNWLDSDLENRIKTLPVYQETFFKRDGEIKTTLATSKVQKQNPDCHDILLTEALRLKQINETLSCLNIAKITRDLFLFGSDILENYETLKKQKSYLDYDDLILTTLNLLTGETNNLKQLKDVSPWIRYKLDQGIDHVLVDEAQDTNPEQWEIIRVLTDDFTENLDEEINRTLFVVGDEKQSIYSFQRASPEKFEQMRQYFTQKFTANNKNFEEVDFITSFRSTKAVLEFVDTVFDNEIYKQGLGRNKIEHQSFRKSQPGSVTLWPLFKNPEKIEKDVWLPPTEIIDSSSGAQQLANYIGDNIRNWLNDKNRILHSYDRQVEPKDIMILLRTRNQFLDQLVRALKIRNIPVSGVDRMVLNDQLVVQDLCAAADFALLPDDSLNLAGLLKSPFIGIDEQTLFDLSYNRKNNSLWDQLRKSEHKNIINWLENLIDQGGKERPYNFFTNIIQQSCPADPISGMRAIKKRLGDESLDPIDEFITLILNYEHNNTPSLQEFLVLQQSNFQQIKRELEDSGNMVKIMTIHGAKGLQSPIVILPDTIRSGSSKKERLLLPQKTQHKLPYFCPTTQNLPDACQSAVQYLNEKETEEYRRLFYVATTRAESELYIAGNTGATKSHKESWYDYATDAFKNLDAQEKSCKFTDEIIYEFSNPATTEKADKKEKITSTINNDVDQPIWLFEEVPNYESPLKTFTPSKPTGVEQEASLSPLQTDDQIRFKRGNIIHKLLQILPDIDNNLWLERTTQFLSLPAHGLSTADQKNILQETLNILNHTTFAPIFGIGSRAEVSVTGIVNNQVLSGQIDRLLVTDTEILIVDYKTNRPPPTDVQDVPQIYIDQMNAYENAMQQIYPDKPIKKALIWTNTAHLMPLD